MIRPFARLVVLAVALVAPAGSSIESIEMESLVNGDDPGQFALVGIGREDLTIADGEIRLSGRPFGYFATKKSYADYDLEFEWRYERLEGMGADAEARFRGNSGVMLHVDGPARVWPRCVQVQLAQADAGALFGMGADTELGGQVDVDAQRKASRPVGRWNRAEIRCDAGTIVCRLNGVEVSRGTSAKPDRGAIGWQSEGTPIRFRRIRIREKGTR